MTNYQPVETPTAAATTAADPCASLFFQRHLSVQWEQNKTKRTAGSSADQEKASKSFEKLALTRRTSSELAKADSFWQSCDSFYRSEHSCSAVQSLQDQLESNQAQHLFQPSDFCILRKLGQGGYGCVYEAVHKPTGHLVALKEVDRESSTVETMEQRTLPLDCGILPCYGTFLALPDHQDNSQQAADPAVSTASTTSKTEEPKELKTWMILKLCRKGSLADRLDKQGALSHKEAARILKRVSKIVTHLYTHHGIVHNDVKTANILFGDHYETDANCSLYVCDLGVSRKGMWQAQRLGGTYSHMAPEKLIARKSSLDSGRYLNDPKIDVFAMGVMLCEMVFMAHPYDCQAMVQYPTACTDSVAKPAHKIADLMEATYGTIRLAPKHAKALDSNPILKDLIEGMLTVEHLERLPLTGIKTHAWVKQHGKWTDRVVTQLKLGLGLVHSPSKHNIVSTKPSSSPTVTTTTKLVSQENTHTTLKTYSRNSLDLAPQLDNETIISCSC